MVVAVGCASEQVEVGESTELFVTSAAHAEVVHQAVVDARDPLRVDRIGQGNVTLDEARVRMEISLMSFTHPERPESRKVR